MIEDDIADISLRVTLRQEGAKLIGQWIAGIRGDMAIRRSDMGGLFEHIECYLFWLARDIGMLATPKRGWDGSTGQTFACFDCGKAREDPVIGVRERRGTVWATSEPGWIRHRWL